MKRLLANGQRWFHRMSPRDQLALLLLMAVVLGYTLVFVVMDSLQQQRSAQQRELAMAAHSLQEVQQLARKILLLQQASATGRSAPRNLTQLIDNSLQGNALQLSGFQPGRDGAMRLRLETAEFDRVLHWLYELETVHGVEVAELSILPTGVAGQVSVQVYLAGEL
jgi:general secretion pathway protein M